MAITLRFPPKLTRGQKGINDGIRLDYLNDLFDVVEPTSSLPPSDSKPQWLEKVWWWQTQTGIPMQRIGAMIHISYLADGGQTLAFYYETLSRALGRYLFDRPFIFLEEEHLHSFYELCVDPTTKFLIPATRHWPLPTHQNKNSTPNYLYDPAILRPNENANQGEQWGEPLAVVFNLKRSNASILAEIEKLINEQRTTAKLPAPEEKTGNKFYDIRTLELWDLTRWKNDAPNRFTEIVLQSMTRTPTNPSKLSNLRELIRAKFPQFASPSETDP